MAVSLTKARFIEPMLLLRTDRLPEGANVQFEVKLDGYRAIGFKAGGNVHMRSRNDKNFSQRYPAIVKALASMIFTGKMTVYFGTLFLDSLNVELSPTYGRYCQFFQ